MLKGLITTHTEKTGSTRAREVLDDWDAVLPKFVKVFPHDYRRVLEAQARMRATGLPEEEAVMAAFEENARSVARAGGS
jgi:glutamate synthase (ferredoxin)